MFFYRPSELRYSLFLEVIIGLKHSVADKLCVFGIDGMRLPANAGISQGSCSSL